MYAAFVKDMNEIDKRAVDEYKIPGILLMENAAMAIYRRIRKHGFKSVVIVCGSGNNGGDGFALARLLKVNGYDVNVFCFNDTSKISGDAKINFDIIISMGFEIKNNLNELEHKIREYDVVVDALFGTGFKGEVKDIYREVIDCINRNAKYIISVDIPSGIMGDSGEKGGICIYAKETITFGCLKMGHILGDGRIASGRVFVDSISIPEECIKKQNILYTTNYGDFPLSIMGKREIDTNKGDCGKVYIIGGSFLMSGAVILAARGALHAGAGLVTCVIPEEILDRVGSSVAEATYMTFDRRDGQSFISSSNLDSIIERADVIAAGVGLGVSQQMTDCISYILRKSEKPVVIDADGINMLSVIKDVLKIKKCPLVLTPHPGEMSRLTGLSIDYINKNRVRVAREFARNYNCIVLLKGASTVVSDGTKVYINTTGNPGMASGGSGDALTGMISALIGQGYSSYDSAVLGAYIHGRAGDDAYEQYGYGLTASDIIKFIGKYIK